MKRYDYYIIDLSLSYSVEDTENRSLNVLNAHTHRNYVVLAGTDQLTGRHSRHTPLNHLLLFLLHLHRQLIGTIAHRQPHPVPVALLIKHVLSYFFRLHLPDTASLLRAAFPGNVYLGESGHEFGVGVLFSRFGVSLRVLILRVVAFLFLLFGFALDFSQGIPVKGVEMLVVEVALLTIFTDFVKIVHVELSEGRNTWRTKEE